MNITENQYIRLLGFLVVFTVIIFRGSVLGRVLNVPFDYATIQMAVDSTMDGDTVLVAPGRYRENINLNLHNIVLASHFLTTRQERFITETIIDGGWNGRSAIRMGSGESGMVCGFTIENDSTDFGAGIYVRFGSPTLSHLIIQDCAVVRNGTAIYVTSAAMPTIRNVVMRRNRCDYVGGAMSVFGGAQATIENCLIYDNYSNHVGGAFHVNGASIYLRNCTIVRNAALHTGGAVYLTQNAKCEAVNCIMWEDEPDEAYIMGGFQTTTFSPWFCLIEGGRERVFAFDTNNVVWGVGNIHSDPRFTNLAERVLTLTEDSPCIDAGHLESLPDPDGTRRDIGYYYFHQERGGQRVRKVPIPYATIQDAIDEAVDGDIILVQSGVYRENINISNKTILLGSQIVCTDSLTYTDETIIDGRGQGVVVSFIGDIGREAVLNGFTITNGQSNLGGGIYCREASPLLTNLKIFRNIARNYGGGIYCSQSASPLLSRVSILENSAQWGGGIAMDGLCNLELNEVIIMNNQAQSQGGGLFATNRSTVRMKKTLIASNQAQYGGGMAIHRNQGEISSLENVTLSLNSAEFSGGAIFLYQMENEIGNLNLKNSIVYFNSAPQLNFTISNPQFMGSVNRVFISYSDIEGGEDDIASEGRCELDYANSNFDADPCFVDIENGDFNLMENSPCIDMGDPTSPVDPDGTRSDIGAFYYHQIIEREPVVISVPGNFASIQAAIDAALPGDTILVAPGRYSENLNFNGKSLVVGSWFLTTRHPRYIRETIIDGGEREVIAKFMRGEGNLARLTGFTLTNGYGREGGAVFCFRSFPTINYCVITGNRAREGGGAVYAYGASPQLVNLTIVGNRSESGAGGLHIRNGAGPTIRNSIIRNNTGGDVVFSADRDVSSLTVYYSNILGGEEGVQLNENGNLIWADGNIDEDPQFIDEDNIDFRLQSESPCIDTGDPESPQDRDGSRADIGALAYDHRLGNEQEFVIQLHRGWNLISSPVEPLNSDMESVWQPLVENQILQVVKDQDGNIYLPSQGFNNIPPWDPLQGYYVKMNDTADLTINGLLIPEDEPIPLRRGWSIVSYLPQASIRPQVAVSGIVNNLIILKDEYGRFYVPRFDWTNIPALQRGKGYQVKVANACNLIWNVGEEGWCSHYNEYFEQSEPIYFKPVSATGRNMSLLIENCKLQIENYFEIGVFTASGLCVGTDFINLQSTIYNLQFGLPVWGDDPTTPEIDGALEGETLTFKIWDGKQERDIDIKWLEGEGVYRSDDFSYGRIYFLSDVPTEFKLYPPFPNPFNETVKIKFDLPERVKTQLVIYNLNGRLVKILKDGYLPAGRYIDTWCSDGLATGIYFVQLNAGKKREIYKLVLMK